MAAEPLLVDTSVLLEATDDRRAHHADALKLVETHSKLTFPAQVVREYLVVATRPIDANGLGMPMADALENVREFRRTIRLLPEEKPLLATLLRLLEEVPCLGKRVHDAHIVAAGLVHKIPRIATLNARDFAPFASQVRAVTPSEARVRAR